MVSPIYDTSIFDSATSDLERKVLVEVGNTRCSDTRAAYSSNLGKYGQGASRATPCERSSTWSRSWKVVLLRLFLRRLLYFIFLKTSDGVGPGRSRYFRMQRKMSSNGY